MELRDLRAFATVVELGGVTRAARRLSVVQSAVSQAVRRLEAELGLALLEHRPGNARPTPAGLALARHAHLVLASVARAEDDMRSYRGLSKGRVSVGILSTLSPLILYPLLTRLKQLRPGLSLTVDEGLAPEMVDKARLGTLDLVATFLPVSLGHLATVVAGQAELAVVLPNDHRLLNRPPPRLGELSQEAWVSFPPHNPGREWLESACARAGFRPRVEVEVQNLSQLKNFVQAGGGLGMLPARAAALEARAGWLAVRRLTPPPQVAVGYGHDPLQPSQAVAAVREVLAEVMREALASPPEAAG